VTFTDDAGMAYHRSVSFYVDPPGGRLLWRTFVGGSCKGSPTLAGGTVYIGATDGKLYALNRSDGKVKWSFAAGGGIIARPLVVGDMVYFGSDDHKLYAVDTNGSLKWTFETKEAVNCPPVYANGLVLFGCNDSDFYAVDAETGRQAWVCTEPEYTMEAEPFVHGDAVYFGAWDRFLYAVDVKTGRLVWRCEGYYSSQKTGSARYYSPADCGPVVCGDKVFVADRGYCLSIIDIATGKIVKWIEKCSAVGLSEDGKSVYARRALTRQEREEAEKSGEPIQGLEKSGLAKLDSEGNPIWAVLTDSGTMPAAVVEKEGVVYMVSDQGVVQAFRASDGAPLWKYSATPSLYVMAAPTATAGALYVAGMDGSITALRTD
jgi:outer membrane protein assembly factor BamB